MIATGSIPIIPKIEGLETINAWTSDQALSAADRPSSVFTDPTVASVCDVVHAFPTFGEAFERPFRDLAEQINPASH